MMFKLQKKVASRPPRSNPYEIQQKFLERSRSLLDNEFLAAERLRAKTDLQRHFLEGEVRIAKFQQKHGLLSKRKESC